MTTTIDLKEHGVLLRVESQRCCRCGKEAKTFLRPQDAGRQDMAACLECQEPTVPSDWCGLPACRHINLGVQFDAKAAEGMSAHEVRKRWPRGHNVTCPDCGETFTVAYASYAHYIMGDW